MDKTIIKNIRLLEPQKMIIYLIVIYIVGVVGMLVESTRPLFIFLVPVNILGAFVITALYHPKPDQKLIWASITILVGGFLIEWIGVKTGAIFGDYEYGEGLGFLLDGVPPIMGLNWLFLVYSTSIIASRWVTNKILLAALGATFMLVYDIFLEPAAIQYNFWHWHGDMIPIQNYIAWWLSAFAFIYLIKLTIEKTIKNIVAEALFWLQLSFFICLWLGNNFYP